MKYYVVDAFAERAFTGSPTGVCVLTDWPEDQLLLNIAAENNLPETAFVSKEGSGVYRLRWFAPNAEVDLCGHATLATAYVIARFVEPSAVNMRFNTMSGPLFIERKGDLFEMDLPSRVPEPIALEQELTDALGGAVASEAYRSRDYFLVFDTQEQVQNIRPDFHKMAALDYGDGVIITAPGTKSDFVTRAFFPKLLTNEDPVCGSAHCNLTPYWAERLGRTDAMLSHQLSERSGTIYCTLAGDRVKIAGKVALYSVGEIMIEKAKG